MLAAEAVPGVVALSGASVVLGDTAMSLFCTASAVLGDIVMEKTLLSSADTNSPRA